MKYLVTAGLCLLLGGCATITRGTKDTWTVNTTPAGAAVRTSNMFSCEQTPCTFKISRKAEFNVTITKLGYREWTGRVTHHIATGGGAAMAGNVILGGVIGAVADASSGAMNDLVPNPLNVTLEKDDGHPSGQPTQQQ
ncbi:PEGA domain-containing protein [Phenylobacterium sp.]|uniref:PEGA domain-containing protein n=1 Tax=Phenylobacterium sp. TaxID=1871053 RepID=UPI00356A5B62